MTRSPARDASAGGSGPKALALREYTCGETRFETRCGNCGEPERTERIGQGKRAQRLTVCGCPETVEAYEAAKSAGVPVLRASEMKGAPSTKRAGKVGENATEKDWRKWGWTTRTTAGSGSVGSRNNESAFDCDVRVKVGELSLTVESKNHSRSGAKSLVEMLGRSDFLRVIEGGKAYYFASAETLGIIAGYAAEAVTK